MEIKKEFLIRLYEKKYKKNVTKELINILEQTGSEEIKAIQLANEIKEEIDSIVNKILNNIETILGQAYMSCEISKFKTIKKILETGGEENGKIQ